MTAQSRIEQQAFPADVQTGENKRRWELCCMAAWLAYGYEAGQRLDRMDLELLHRSTRTFYESALDSGQGALTEEQRSMLREAGAL